MAMVIEAFDKKGTKFKVGSEVEIKGTFYYVFDIVIDDESGKALKILCIDKDLAGYTLSQTALATPTGNYEPDILKLKRKLAKK